MLPGRTKRPILALGMTPALPPRVSTTLVALLWIVCVLPRLAAGDPPGDRQEGAPRAAQVTGAPDNHTFVMPWGTPAGMRVEGEWIEFEAGLRVVRPDWSGFSPAVKYLQRPRYARGGDRRTVTSTIENLSFTLSAQDRAVGEAELEIEATVPAGSTTAGIFWCFEIPAHEFAGGSVEVLQAEDRVGTVLAASLRVQARMTSKPPGERVSMRLKLRASTAGDAEPARLTLDATRPGHSFDGIGGNFRLQFPRTDPSVIQYNLDHLRVAWGRVDMPWADWDPDESAFALETARGGRLASRVREAMAMAQTLSRRGLPVIVSAWDPPRWARSSVPQPPGARGVALDEGKLPRICRSLAVHLVNNGGQRPVVPRGLPERVSAPRRLVTDATREMEESGRVEVRSGKAEFVLSPASYTTLLGGPSSPPAK